MILSMMTYPCYLRGFNYLVIDTVTQLDRSPFISFLCETEYYYVAQPGYILQLGLKSQFS